MGDIDREDLKKVLEALSKKKVVQDGDIIEVPSEGGQKPTKVVISVSIDETECHCEPPTPLKNTQKNH